MIFYEILLVGLGLMLGLIVFNQFFRKGCGNGGTVDAGSQTDIFKEHTRIIDILKRAVEQKARARVRINDQGKTYSSSLLKIDTSPGNSGIIIDTLFPAEGNERIHGSDFMGIEFNLDEAHHGHYSIQYVFNSFLLRSCMLNGYPALEISVPPAVRRGQKRCFLRIEPSINSPVYVRFFLGKSEYVQKVINISAGGMCFCSALNSSVLSVGKVIHDMVLDLPRGEQIKTSGAIRSAVNSEIPVVVDNIPHHTLCGIEFVGLENKMRDSVLRFVTERERLELKRLNRQFE